MARANPFRAALGLDVSFPVSGQAVVDAPARPGNLGADGRMAPGLVLTLLDVALGHAVAARLPEPSSFATVSLEILVRSPWPEGSLSALGAAEPLAADWREAVADGRVLARDGRIIATAQGLFARGTGQGRAVTLTADAGGTFRNLDELLGFRETDGVLAMAVEQRHLNPDGVMHGGAMVAVLDAAMRTTLERAGAPDVRLGSLSIRYILPAHPGEIRALCHLERRGRRIHFASASAVDGDGSLLAAADATYLSLIS